MGVITVQRSRASGHCVARDHASAQYPVLCHGHSPDYISHSLNKYVTLSLK